MSRVGSRITRLEGRRPSRPNPEVAERMQRTREMLSTEEGRARARAIRDAYFAAQQGAHDNDEREE